MMKTYHALCIFVFVLAVGFKDANAQDVSPSLDLTKIIEIEMEAQNTAGLSVAVYHQGDVVYAEGFGTRHIETGDAVTTDTVFRVGSVTKPLTAIGVLTLVEDGKIDLDAPVVDYVPEFTVDDGITIRQLLSHTAGLKDDAIAYGSLAQSALEQSILALEPDALFVEPGTILSYANTGYNTLGLVIERVSGVPYADYMADIVFPSLGMTRTTLYPNMAMTYPLAVGHLPGQDGLTVVRPNPDNVAEYPSGMVFSTAEDLTQLVEFLLNNGVVNDVSLIAADLVQDMKTPVFTVDALNTGYSLGMFISERDGLTSVHHAGNILGYVADVEVFPAFDLGIVILTNTASFDNIAVIEAILRQYTDASHERAPDEPVTLTPDELRDYVGDYQFETISGDVSEIGVVLTADSGLQLSLPQMPLLQLVPLGNDLFAVYSGERRLGQMAFIRDANGAVACAFQGARSMCRVS